MSIPYSIYQNPPRRDGQTPANHIQVKNLVPADRRAVARRMHKIDGLYSVGANVGALVLLEQALAELLAEGHSVRLGDLGTLTPRVEADISRQRGALVARGLRVSGVDFRPAATLLDAVNRQASFRRLPERRSTAVGDHDTLTRGDLIRLLGISRDRARAILNRLVAEGTLCRIGARATTRYHLP